VPGLSRRPVLFLSFLLFLSARKNYKREKNKKSFFFCGRTRFFRYVCLFCVCCVCDHEKNKTTITSRAFAAASFLPALRPV
jgi:hypothetical protein